MPTDVGVVEEATFVGRSGNSGLSRNLAPFYC